MQNNYLVQPYAVGKDKRSLAMVIPYEIVRSLRIDPLNIYLLLKVEGFDKLQIKIIREEDLANKYTENMIPADKVYDACPAGTIVRSLSDVE